LDHARPELIHDPGVGVGVGVDVAALRSALAVAYTDPLTATLNGPLPWRALAVALVRCWQQTGNAPCRLAIAGGQGAGKSTLARLLAEATAALGGPRACVLSLDDFYLPRAERAVRADHWHPLWGTRGVPGTHDVALLIRCMRALRGAAPVYVPRFDKGRDDRNGERRLDGPFAMVIVEGWVLGARAQPPGALAHPVNALERDEDRHGNWRRLVNAELASAYARLNAGFDALIFLSVPDMAAVRRWRGAQEQGLPADRRQSERQLQRFIAHYERLTAWMSRDVPQFATLTVDLAADHTIAGLRGPQRSSPVQTHRTKLAVL
jgi:D-glycerate 3-kinase